MSSKVQTGTVKFFLKDKGFGFITPDSTPDKDIFFHLSGMLEDVGKNDLVEFETKNGKKGTKAVNIRKL